MPSQVTVKDPSMLYFKAKPPFAYKFTHSQINLKTSLQKFSPISSTLISPLLTMKLFSCSHFLKTLLPLTLFPPLHFIFAPLCSKIPLKNCLYTFYNSSALILFFFSKFTTNRLFSTPLSQNYSWPSQKQLLSPWSNLSHHPTTLMISSNLKALNIIYILITLKFRALVWRNN